LTTSLFFFLFFCLAAVHAGTLPIENKELLEKELTRRFQEAYPTLRIEAVTLKPSTRRDGFRYDPGRCGVRVPKSALRRSFGTVIVKCDRKSHFLHYRILGTLRVYKATHQIKKDKIISSDRVESAVIPFTRLRARPMEKAEIGRRIAKRNIPGGKVVDATMIAPIPDVRKNERVRCLYNEDGIVIEFDGIALQNGYIGDNITLRKGDGRTLRGVVTGKKRVEIE
jgi:flagella basal body P-ring formation protein FlgA